MVETRRLSQLRSRSAGLLQLPVGDLALALSGGADSAALADLLATLGRDFRAVHVNHGLPASPRLEEAARAVADAVGAKLEVVQVEVPAGASFEAQARTARYEALLSSLEPEEILLTAHTLDDQAETVLMNLLRGTGPTGLSGIASRSGSLARPLLAVTRSETRELATLASLPFFDDPSNLDLALRRNVIRLEVIPALSARFNPRLVEALARTATLMAADDTYLEGEAADLPVLGSESSLALPLGSLYAVPRPVADRALRRCLARLRPPHPGSAAEMDEIWGVARREGKSTTLAGGVAVAHEGPLLVFRSGGTKEPPSSRIALTVGTHQVGRFEVTVERVERACRVAPIGLWSAIFRPDSSLAARVDGSGHLIVEADSETAWLPGERRLPVAWYEPGSSGYLSVFVGEGSGWTSSP